MGSTLHSEQALYARLEDDEHKAKDLDPANPHREKELAAEDAEWCCYQLAEHFRERGDTWRMKVAQYREHKQTGE